MPARGVLTSTTGGIGTLADHLGDDRCDWRFAEAVQAVERAGGGFAHLRRGTTDDDRVVICATSYAAADMVEPPMSTSAPARGHRVLADRCRGLRLPFAADPLDGFGLLHDLVGRLPILGVLWDGSTAPFRAPVGSRACA